MDRCTTQQPQGFLQLSSTRAQPLSDHRGRRYCITHPPPSEAFRLHQVKSPWRLHVSQKPEGGQRNQQTTGPSCVQSTVKNKATTETRLRPPWDSAEAVPRIPRPVERGPRTPTGLGLAGREVGSPVEARVAKNGDLVGLVVGWRKPDYSGAVASAPSSESHTSDCR